VFTRLVFDSEAVADLIAIGTAMSTNLCSGRKMPYRSGRIDATSAGITTGVPAPETPLDETLEQFERAGFDRVDAIGLTACGHTMGSVHHVCLSRIFNSSP
jgi:catalase (peroxidase I)